MSLNVLCVQRHGAAKKIAIVLLANPLKTKRTQANPGNPTNPRAGPANPASLPYRGTGASDELVFAPCRGFVSRRIAAPIIADMGPQPAIEI